MTKWNYPPSGGHLDKPSGIYFQTMTKLQIEQRLEKNDVIIVPVGSTENHGNAGPTGEDTFMVTRVAEMVAQQTGCTVSAPIWFGSHPFHHIGQPLTVPIPDSVFIDYLRAIISGYWNSGFRKQIYISLHGQEYSLPVALQEWGKRYQVPAMLYFVDFPRVMAQTMMDKAHGGPFNRPFQHACEAEQSLSLSLFPELCDQANAQDTETGGFLPKGHVDRGGDIYGYPIPGHCAVGNVGMECVTHPEGVLGHATEAEACKAGPAVEKICDYLELLIHDILATFPVGQLPPAELMSQRDPALIADLLKGPTHGGKHLYTLGWPT